jgi:dTDP-4-amino-4,6-dideoxygalactose transaminase
LDFSELQTPVIPEDIDYNFAYYPVFFKSEGVMNSALKALAQNEIFPRRYFYPSLNTLHFMPEKFHCPISQDLSSRVLCLPLYYDLLSSEVEQISEIVNSVVVLKN